MKSYIFISILLMLVGCNFLEVQVEVSQRCVLDSGENKKKVIQDDNTDTDTDATETIIKTIP